MSALGDALLLERGHAFGQYAAAQTRESAPQVAEALGSQKKLSKDQQYPAMAEDFGGSGQGAELVVTERIHGREATTSLVLK
jgi:hypothetical protein